VTRAVCVLVVAALGVAVGVEAQTLEPRAFSNSPVGLNFLVVGYAYSHGDVALDSAVPIKDASLTTHSTFLGYGHVFDLWGRTAQLDVALPYAWVSGSAVINGKMEETAISGLGDPQMRASVLLYGGPALPAAEFGNYEPDVVVGVALAVTAPLGQYDSDRLVNVGTNRWSFRPELGLSKTLGPITLELIPSVTLYTNNTDFLGHTLEKEPVYAVQGHVVYHTRIGFWMALDAIYYTGGRETINGKTGSEPDHSRFGATIAIPIDRYNSVKLYGNVGATPRLGGDFYTAGIAWQVRWGGGY
jgi:hypothetical protein